MAYVPPPPGSTVAGQPTPDGVKKQDVHITDLPPEVRKSFLLSMIFFPSMVGAAICLLMFLGWVTIFKPKEAVQYAAELESPDMRRRWTAAREMSEHISRYQDTNVNPRVYSAETVGALINILANPDLDKERAEWSPSGFIKQQDEKISIRWWAARMLGHVAAKMPDAAEKDKAYKALLPLLEEHDSLAIYAAHGLALMRDRRAGEALARHLENNPNAGIRWASAQAIGAIGESLMLDAKDNAEADRFRGYLVNAWQLENGKPKRDEFLLDNLAVGLGRMRESSGRARLKQMGAHEDPEVRRIARTALQLLDTPPDSTKKK